MDSFWGSSGKVLSGLRPEQQQIQDQILQLLGPLLQQQFGSSGIGALLSNSSLEGFEPIERQSRERFKSETIPSIMERFAATDSVESSALPQMLGSAGAELETGLGALRSQYDMQNRNQLMQSRGQLMQLLGLGLGDTMYEQPTQGFMGGVAPGVGKGIAKYMIPALASLIGNAIFPGVGGAVGGAAGSAASSLF